MWWMSLFLACQQQLNSGTNLRWVRGSELVQGSSGSMRCFRVPPGYVYTGLKTSGVVLMSGMGVPKPKWCHDWLPVSLCPASSAIPIVETPSLTTGRVCQSSKVMDVYKSKSKSHYDRQSVGKSVLVSGAHLGPATNCSFSLRFSLDSCGFVIL
jgi:hypothetical protein